MSRKRNRIIVAIVLFVIFYVFTETGLLDICVSAFVDARLIPQLEPARTAAYALYVEFVLFAIPYVIGGADVFAKAVRGIAHGQALDENFLMTIASLGAFALVFFPDSEPHMAEGAAVILFYQVGELFQSYAVDRSRRSITEMMDIVPEFANIMVDGVLTQVDPEQVGIGDEIVVKPGERIPLDGIVTSGSSQIDTAALTGESVPRSAHENDEVISGCVNLTGTLTVRVTKPFEDSTVNRVLELVEGASARKARREDFITRFAHYYTPIVVGVAVVLAVIPPLLAGGQWADWVERGLVFLVVSCPCALVISIPLSFFGGIGGASRIGILVKGSNYLEALAHTDTVVFDKTGTLTNGTFAVTHVHAADGFTDAELLAMAACAEAYSNHPIAASVRTAFEQDGGRIDAGRIGATEEISGHGVRAVVDGADVLVGNTKLMDADDIAWEPCDVVGTELYVAADGVFAGHIVIADTIKDDAREAICDLHAEGIRRIVMLTGDHERVAAAVADELGIDEYYANLLPQDKVARVEGLLSEEGGAVASATDDMADAAAGATGTAGATAGAGKTRHAKETLAFVGDGINDAPVLARADIGIAMGALGSDAAIEAADIVLMDDRPTNIARAIAIARKTMRIANQNIVFALGVKFIVLILAVFGIATMWLAVFADVGVAILAILNAMRAMRVRSIDDRLQANIRAID